MTNSVAVTISAFKSDEMVIELLESIFSNPHPLVKEIVVVDSLGSGKIQTTIAERGWRVHYKNVDCNLGSAGNLWQRLNIAMSLDVAWCLCLNHDAEWSSDRLTQMLLGSECGARVGAIYPVLDHHPRTPRWVIGRDNYYPASGLTKDTLPELPEFIPVKWSSSNHALYSIRPFKEGIQFMRDLWHGYEDLAIGIELERAGWEQFACTAAVLPRSVEYKNAKFLGKSFNIPDKPVWYSYYIIRNLVLIRKKYGSKYLSGFHIFGKLIQSTARILLLESQKMNRIRLLYSGTLMGLASEAGKGKVP